MNAGWKAVEGYVSSLSYAKKLAQSDPVTQGFHLYISAESRRPNFICVVIVPTVPFNDQNLKEKLTFFRHLQEDHCINHIRMLVSSLDREAEVINIETVPTVKN